MKFDIPKGITIEIAMSTQKFPHTFYGGKLCPLAVLSGEIEGLVGTMNLHVYKCNIIKIKRTSLLHQM